MTIDRSIAKGREEKGRVWRYVWTKQSIKQSFNLSIYSCIHQLIFYQSFNQWLLLQSIRYTILYKWSKATERIYCCLSKTWHGQNRWGESFSIYNDTNTLYSELCTVVLYKTVQNSKTERFRQFWGDVRCENNHFVGCLCMLPFVHVSNCK